MHASILNDFGVNGNAPFPDSNTLVVRSRAKASIVVKESDGIDRAQMSIVFLNNLSATSIPLYDFLVLHPCQEYILFVIIWIEFDARSTVTSMEAILHLA